MWKGFLTIDSLLIIKTQDVSAVAIFLLYLALYSPSVCLVFLGVLATLDILCRFEEAG